MRYPLVEALTGVLCVGAVLVHHSAVSIALSILVILLVVPAALIDLEYRIIPNRMTAARCDRRARGGHRAGSRPVSPNA